MAGPRRLNRSEQERTHQDPAGHSRLSRLRTWFRRFAAGFVLAETYLNGPGLNTVMSEELRRPPVAAPELSGSPVQTADQLVAALLEFVQSGDYTTRMALSATIRDLFAQNSGNPDFMARLGVRMQSRSDVFYELFRALEHRLGHSPNFVEFTDAFDAVRSQIESTGECDQAIIEGYGSAFIRQVELTMHGHAIPVSVPRRADDIALNHLLQIFEAGTPPADASREERMSLLARVVGTRFGIIHPPTDAEAGAPSDFGQALRFTRALLNAYSRLNGREQGMFGDWLGQLSPEARQRLVSAVTSGTATVAHVPIYNAAREYAQDTERPDERLRRLEAEANDYPMYIREGSFSGETGMLRTFANAPSDYGLELISIRLEHLRARMTFLQERNGEDDSEEIARIETELNELDRWLTRIGISAELSEEERLALSQDAEEARAAEQPAPGEETAEAEAPDVEAGAEEAEGIEAEAEEAELPSIPTQRTLGQRLAYLRDGLFTCQQEYYLTPPQSPALSDFLAGVSSTELRIIYSRYISEIDSRALGMFDGLDPTAPNYAARVRARVMERYTAADIAVGQTGWHDTYYPTLGVAARVDPETGEEIVPASQRESAMYALVDELDPLAAAAFRTYMESVSDHGVGSEDERRWVAIGLATVYAVNPILVLSYIRAITNLSELCEGNPELFREVLVRLTGRIRTATDAFLSDASPTAASPTSTREIITLLDNAFSTIIHMSQEDFSEYGRLELTGDHLEFRPAPHPVVQRGPGYRPDLLAPSEDRPRGTHSYFLPMRIDAMLPGDQFTQGSLGGGAYSYTADAAMPTLRPFQLVTLTSSVGSTFHAYLYPQHPDVSPDAVLPGSDIALMSGVRLFDALDRAFIRSRPPEYDIHPTAGGLGVGFEGGEDEAGDATLSRIGGLGSLLTPTGGYVLGGSYATGGETYFLGGAIVAQPIAIPVISGQPIRTLVGEDARGLVTGLTGLGRRVITGVDSAVAGGERLDSGVERQLVRWLQSHYDPEHPERNSQSLLVFNREESAEDPETHETRSYWVSEYYYVARDGTIYRLMGGQSEFVDILNYAAGYINQGFGLPATMAYNVEPTVDRGGGMLAFDLGRSDSILLHAQALPFLTRDDQPQPLLLQWTAAYSHVSRRGEGDGRSRTIYSVALPGQFLQLRPGEDGTEDFHVLQDAEFRVRRIRGADGHDRLEVIVGGGVLSTPPAVEEAEPETQDTEPVPGSPEPAAGEEQGAGDEVQAAEGERGWGGRAGFFVRSVRVDGGTERRIGGGAYYEAGATNLEAIAIMQSEEQYLQSLHRLGFTLYGSRQAATGLVLGGLGHFVEQLREEQLASGDSEVSHDRAFYRFVGFIAGMRDVEEEGRVRSWGVRLSLSRYDSVMDRMVADYHRLQEQVGRDPTRADTYLADFQRRYGETVRTVLDEYDLAVQVNRDFSLELALVAREPAGEGVSDTQGWLNQLLETVLGRALVTWSSGAARVYVQMPILNPSAFQAVSPEGDVVTDSAQMPGGDGTVLRAVGIAGAGFAQDLLPGAFLNRIALDAGVIVARYESGAQAYAPPTDPETGEPIVDETGEPVGDATDVREWTAAGAFVQGAVQVYSDILTDSRAYRTLEHDYEVNLRHIRSGDFSLIDPEIRVLIVAGLAGSDSFPVALLDQIRDGESEVTLTGDQRDLAERALLTEWFVLRRDDLQARFTSHMRAYIGASGYFYSDRTYFDIAAFVEWVDHARAYFIAAQREDAEGDEQMQYFTGVDIAIPGRRATVRAGAAVAVTEDGDFAAAASLGVDFVDRRTRLPMSLSVQGYAMEGDIQPYAAPFVAGASREQALDFGGMVIFTIGAHGAPTLRVPGQPVAPRAR